MADDNHNNYKSEREIREPCLICKGESRGALRYRKLLERKGYWEAGKVCVICEEQIPVPQGFLDEFGRESDVEVTCCPSCSGESDIPRFLRDGLERERSRRLLDQQQQQQQQRKKRNPRVRIHPIPYGRQLLLSLDATTCFNLSVDVFTNIHDLIPRSYDPGLSYNGVKILGSNGGLLLLCVSDVTDHVHNYDYYICNPLNKQWFELPKPPLRRSYDIPTGFIYEPCHNNNITEDEKHHIMNCTLCKFKVVRFTNLNPKLGSEYNIEQFDDDTSRRDWSVVTVPCEKEFRWHGDKLPQMVSHFYKGRLHWITTGGKIVVYDPYHNKKISVIPGPRRAETCLHSAFTGLGLSNGTIWLCQYAEYCGDLRFWKLIDYDNSNSNNKCSWRIQHLFNFGEIAGQPTSGPKFKYDGILAIHPVNPDIVFMRLENWRTREKHIGLCNLRTRSFRKIISEFEIRPFYDGVITLSLPYTTDAVTSLERCLCAS